MSFPERGVPPQEETNPDRATQIARVKEHLLAGNFISQLQAYELVQSTRLAAIIYDLRYVHNMNIYSVWNYSQNRRKKYAIYVLREHYVPETHGTNLFFS